MKLKLIAIGNSRNSYEMKLFQLYVRRITFSFELIEVVVKKNISRTRRKIEESSLLLSRVTNGSVIVALDERGQRQKRRLGFNTNVKTRKLILDLLRRLIRERGIEIFLRNNFYYYTWGWSFRKFFFKIKTYRVSTNNNYRNN